MWRIMWKSSGGLWCLSDGKKDVGKEEVPGPPFLIYHPLVSVFVSGSPKAVVSIKPDTHVFIGEIVTVRCDIQGGGDTQGTYSWKLINSENGRERFSTDNTKQVVKIQSVKDSGTYTCSIKGRDSQSSEISDAVTLTVSAKPKATVRVNPQSSVYTGDTVTLSCELQQGTGWVFDWYKKNQKQNLNSEQAKTLNVTVDNAGETEYQCRASRLNFDEYGDTRYYYTDLSDPVKITVSAKPKLTVRVNPQSSVYTGDTVTLSCELQQETGWGFHWYRNNQLQNLNREQENTLKVTVDNAGETEYRCRANRINNNYYYFTEFSDPVKITVKGMS
ncbi:titin-like [Hemibagrus wyckioides]|uniref:titin-like n=1 Tax=Hemibagrus wyckioides TaxID=337641 RepID=UPI00266C00E1|nr:titin-like [Hemibagrus wyckioides]